MTKSLPQISRDSARAIAAARVDHNCIVAGKVRVGKVLSSEEIELSSPVIYGFPLQGLWIAYVERGDRSFAPKSSLVVLISKATGEIVYVGSANDEG